MTKEDLCVALYIFLVEKKKIYNEGEYVVTIYVWHISRLYDRVISYCVDSCGVYFIILCVIEQQMKNTFWLKNIIMNKIFNIDYQARY